ncbi:MAG: hypothetical protein AAFV19_04825 [Pseudomonadota bacterium]
MNMLIEEIQMLANDPKSWVAVALMVLIAGHSVATVLLCPYSHGKAKIDDIEVSQARGQVFTVGARFGLMMVVGIALTVGGLFMIASGTKPALALIAMVSGLVITQTEPVRLRIREGKSSVIANRDSDETTAELMRGRLHSDQKELALSNVVTLAALVGGLLVF